MHMILFFLTILSSSQTWCPIDPSVLTPINAVVTRVSSPSFVPQCAGLTLIGCATLYSWYSCNEKAIKLTTLCGALASSYILYKYVHSQEEIKELLTDATNHITQTTIESETRISQNLEKVSNHTQQQISDIHQSLQSDIVSFKQEVHKKMDESLTEMREQFLNAEKKSDLNRIELEHTIETSSAQLKHTITQGYLELSSTFDQKKEESDKLLQESTNYMVTQMQNMVNELARAQSITLPIQKNTFIPQKLTHLSSPPQVVHRSTSQPEIFCEPIKSSITIPKKDINQKFEQDKQTLHQNYKQKQSQIIEQHAKQQAALKSTKDPEADDLQDSLTKPVILRNLTFDPPPATSFSQKPLSFTVIPSESRWLNIFAFFSFFSR